MLQTPEIPVLFGSIIIDGNDGYIHRDYQRPGDCPKQYPEDRRSVSRHQENRGKSENGIFVFGIIGQTEEFREITPANGDDGETGFPSAMSNRCWFGDGQRRRRAYPGQSLR